MRKLFVVLTGALLSSSVLASNECSERTAEYLLVSQATLAQAMQDAMIMQINKKIQHDIYDDIPVMSTITYYPQRNEIVIAALLLDPQDQ